MKFNEIKFSNVYLKIALLSKGILCDNIYKKILLFSVLYIFKIWILQFRFPNYYCAEEIYVQSKSCADFSYFMQYTYQDFCC